jgi:BirA family biotin operon repressor/biotin-[acetyl-CoA-carboxylase] ligase
MGLEQSSNEKPPAWDAETVWKQLEPLLPGLSVEVVAHADSTNTQLLQRFRGAARALVDTGSLPGRRASDSQPCLLVAQHQTQGRGRAGRPWQSVAGATLTFSLALPLSPPQWSGLSLAVGVALADALDPEGTPGWPRVLLKWPNDLWVDERKLGGILIETLVVGTQRLAVIGVGLNVRPLDHLNVSTGYASLSEVQPEATVQGALHQVALPLARALRAFEREGFAAFQSSYDRRDLLKGRSVRSGVIEGVAQGVDETGALRVLTDSGETPISSSEVSVRLSTGGPTQAGQP